MRGKEGVDKRQFSLQRFFENVIYRPVNFRQFNSHPGHRDERGRVSPRCAESHGKLKL